MQSKILSSLVAASMMFGSVAAAAAPGDSAASLSVAGQVRAGAPVEDANQLTTTEYVLIGLGVTALIVLIIVIADDNNPSSP